MCHNNLCNEKIDYDRNNCVLAEGLKFGYHTKDKILRQSTMYFFNPLKESQSKEFFRYLQENINGQFYKDGVIDHSISYIKPREKGEIVKVGENLTCFDNTKIGKGQSPTEVECSNGQDTCKIVATNDDLEGHLLIRSCAKFHEKIQFDYCWSERSQDGKMTCSCFCHKHLCNNFTPKCKFENMFIMHHSNFTQNGLQVFVTPALDTNPEQFLSYMESKYLSQGYVYYNTTTTTTTTTTTATTTTTITTTTTTSTFLLTTVKNTVVPTFIVNSSLVPKGCNGFTVLFLYSIHLYLYLY